MTFKEFCIEIFKVGCIGFGGGNALVPVIDEAFIRKGQLKETAEEYDQDVIVANLTPGALPVELAGALGKRNFGRKGMVLGPVLFALPGIIGATILFVLLATIRDEVMEYIYVASVGVACFIIALLTMYIQKVLKKSREEGRVSLGKTVFVIAGVCLVTCGGTLLKILGIDRLPLLSVTTIQVLAAVFFIAFYVYSNYSVWRLVPAVVLCVIFFLGYGKAGVLADTKVFLITQILMVVLAVYGASRAAYERKERIEIDRVNFAKDIAFWLVLIAVFGIPAVYLSDANLGFLCRDILSTLMSFGGGDAYLTIADGMFVDTGFVGEGTFYTKIITVVNVLPGSILCKTLYGVGFFVGYYSTGQIWIGILVGIAGFICSISASCVAFFTLYYIYDSIAQYKAISFISRWIRPIVCGLLIKVMLSLCYVSMQVPEDIRAFEWTILVFILVMAALNVLLKNRTRIGSWLLVLMDIAAAMAFFYI